MRLASFILENLDIILQEWEDFAITLVPRSDKMDQSMLRDNAKKMLETIAADLAQPETKHFQAEKSKGQQPAANQTSAMTHGSERLASGFSLVAAMAEYRALRASVTRLWQEKHVNQPAPKTGLNDLIRFNEAIDQAMSESVTFFSVEKEQQTRVFDTILSSSPDLSFTFTLDGNFAYANKALMDLLALSLDQIVGKNYTDLGFLHAAELQRDIEQVIGTKEPVRGEHHCTVSPNPDNLYEYIFAPVLNQAGTVEAVAGTARNITERKAAEYENWKKANYDLLTGLPNRRLFRDRLEQNVKHSVRIDAPIALLFIDLDHFKEANDQFGHAAGDLLLRLVAERLRFCVRETDTVARLGGDEFTVILQDLTDARHAELVAEKILRELARPFPIFIDTLHISASIGIAFCPRHARTATDLIKSADQAMYAAKDAGRNRFSLFSPDHEQPEGVVSAAIE